MLMTTVVNVWTNTVSHQCLPSEIVYSAVDIIQIVMIHLNLILMLANTDDNVLFGIIRS